MRANEPRDAGVHKICKQIREILNGLDKRPANPFGKLLCMGNIISVSFRQSRLPRSLVRDGWWLESSPRVVPFPKPPAQPSDPIRPKPGPKAAHLTLVHCRK